MVISRVRKNNEYFINGGEDKTGQATEKERQRLRKNLKTLFSRIVQSLISVVVVMATVTVIEVIFIKIRLY